MIKCLGLFIFCLLLSGVATAASRYVVVGVSGYGTGRDGRGQPSGAHANLPQDSQFEVHQLVHKASPAELSEVLQSFRCSNGTQAEADLGLMIMANSWGAGKAVKLAQMYQAQCGRLPALFVMIDGVSKPIGSFRKAIPAQRCVNFYQTASTIRGAAINGCENTDLTPVCGGRGGLATCHIMVEWEGSQRGSSLLRAKLYH